MDLLSSFKSSIWFSFPICNALYSNISNISISNISSHIDSVGQSATEEKITAILELSLV